MVAVMDEKLVVKLGIVKAASMVEKLVLKLGIVKAASMDGMKAASMVILRVAL